MDPKYFGDFESTNYVTFVSASGDHIDVWVRGSVGVFGYRSIGPADRRRIRSIIDALGGIDTLVEQAERAWYDSALSRVRKGEAAHIKCLTITIP